MKKFFAIVIFIAVLASGALPDAPPRSNPEFVFARLALTNREEDSWRYWPQYFPDNPPWHHDYPFSDELIVSLLHELTGVSVTPDSYKIVRLDSPEVFKYPFVYLSEPGFMILNDKEIANLGEYIRRGGFIMADDFRTGAYLGYGDPEELDVLRYYLKKAVPERELVRLDVNDPVFHSFYDLETLNMKPPYGEGLLVPQFWGMHDERGRLQVIANYNNDIGDFWKYIDLGTEPLDQGTQAIRLTINYIIYSMTH